MKNKNLTNYTIIITIFFCIVMCAYLVVRISQMDSQISRLKRNISLSRVLLPGKSKTDVIAWMGEPDKTINKKEGIVILYKSNPNSIQYNDDIVILLDENDKILSVYYPDNHQDREIVESKKLMIENP